MQDIADLPLKIVAVLAVSMQQDQWSTLSFCNEIVFYIHNQISFLLFV